MNSIDTIREALEKARKINRSILSGGPSDTAALNTLALLNEALAALRSEVHGISVDELANEIRRVDGSNSLGAGALAEALIPFLTKAAKP